MLNCEAAGIAYLILLAGEAACAIDMFHHEHTVCAAIPHPQDLEPRVIAELGGGTKGAQEGGFTCVVSFLG